MVAALLAAWGGGGLQHAAPAASPYPMIVIAKEDYSQLQRLAKGRDELRDRCPSIFQPLAALGPLAIRPGFKTGWTISRSCHMAFQASTMIN
jgi:hypothetical protein